jgi:fructose-1,6-bisphosphatase/inositol monophosphatase family enzyme
MNNYQKELDTAISIAKEAGEIMLKYFDIEQQVEIKGDNTQVTIADKLINSLVIKKLADAFPEDGVVGEEESTAEYGMGRKWFCDPIDGTAGYIWGTPTSMFSLALVIDGKPMLGVAYDPFLDRLYTGRKSFASECNGQRISVSNLSLKEGIIAMTGNLRTLATAPYFKKMADDKIRLATFSGLVYKGCLVARGKFAGYIEMGANAHDYAAVQVIVEGAGGKVTSPQGKELDYSRPFNGAIFSNKIVHDDLLSYCG